MAQKRPSNPDLARAMRLFQSGDLKRAEQAAKAALAAAPGEASQILAGIALKRGDHLSAHGHAARAAEAAPNNVNLLLNLGTIEFALDRRDDALATFTKAADLNPGSFDAQLGLGKALAAMKRLEEALDRFQRAHQINAHALAKGPIADTLFKLKRYDDAETWALAAVAAGLNTSELTGLIGKIHLAKHSPGQAAAAFRKALEKNPSDRDALMGLACASSEQRDLIAARESTRLYLQLRPVIRAGAAAPEAQVAVVHSFPRGHFTTPQYGEIMLDGGSFPTLLESDRLQFHHYFTTPASDFPGPAKGFRADIVLNNLVNAEALHGEAADRARAALASFEAPVVNVLDAVLSTSHAANAERFRGAAKFRFPKAVAYRKQDQKLSDIADAILAEFDLPVVLQPPGRPRLITAQDQLVNALGQIADGAFHVSEHVDYRGDDDHARRYRLSVVGGEVFATNMNARPGWNAQTGDDRVGVNWEGGGFADEERKFLEHPEAVLGDAPENVFGEIIEKTPLDIYAIDFGIARTGEIVVLAVDAATTLTLPALAEKFDYLRPHRAALFARIDALLVERALQAKEGGGG